MNIRPYDAATDLEALKQMHAEQGFDYVCPNFDHPEFFTRLVAEDEAGRPVMAIMGRLTAEMFLLLDPQAGKPGDRLKNFLVLHMASEHDMASRGIQDCYAQIPPEMGKFKRLLGLLGWVPADTWQPWTKPQLTVKPLLPKFGVRLLGGIDGPQRTTAGERSISGTL